MEARIFRVYCWLLVLWVASQGGIAVAGEIYTWMDANGDLHVTDRLNDVPEPYYSLYVAEENERRDSRELEGASAGEKAAPEHHVAGGPQASPKPVRRPGVAARSGSLLVKDAVLKKRWSQLLAQWRTELRVATERLAAIDKEIAEARHNPILSQTPQIRQRVAALGDQRIAARARVDNARRMLIEELPERARREGVPPKWLYEAREIKTRAAPKPSARTETEME